MNKQVKQSIILSLALLLAIVQGAQAQESISVYANNDNHTNWTEYNGQTVSSFTIHNRTLYKDGKWNTLCLPFDLTIAGSVLNGADVQTLSSSSFNSNTGELTLNFTPSPDETVWFKPATDGGKVAEVTASSDTRLLHFIRITFLLNSAWPFNNADSKWHLGDIVHNVHLEADIEKRFESGDIPRDWVCVREAGSTYTIMGKTIGIPPMFCAITKQSYITPYNGFYDSFWISTSKYSPGLSTAGAIKDLLNYDWDFFVECFRESGNGELSGAHGYWVNDRHVTWYLTTYYEVYYYQTGAHYGEDSKVNKPYLLKIDWVEDGQMHDGGTY